MIEVRIDIHWMQTQQQNILHSILMMQALREAGMPIIGKIVFNGPERGQLIQWRENTLDGDDWVVQWWDDRAKETGMYGKGRAVARGSGKGFSWIRYADSNNLDEPVSTAAWDEDEL